MLGESAVGVIGTRAVDVLERLSAPRRFGLGRVCFSNELTCRSWSCKRPSKLRFCVTPPGKVVLLGAVHWYWLTLMLPSPGMLTLCSSPWAL